MNKSILAGSTCFIVIVSFLAIPHVSAYSCRDDSNLTYTMTIKRCAMTAIIVTSHDPDLENKLAIYDTQFGLPACTVENGCLEIATPYGTSNSNPSSNSDMLPFVVQAHQASPDSKILVVEAKSISWQDKMDAANYAKTLPEVAKVSSVSYSKVVMIIGLVLK